MKVKDLIRALQRCNPEATVIAGSKVEVGRPYPPVTEVEVTGPHHVGPPIVKILTHNLEEPSTIASIMNLGHRYTDPTRQLGNPTNPCDPASRPWQP